MSAPDWRDVIAQGRTALGIELGSTRIKACLVAADDPATVIALGTHLWENRYEDGCWTYSLDEVWSGIRAAIADLGADAEARHGTRPGRFGSIGVSAMMHGYLAFDAAGELLVPFRTWRNTSTVAAADELVEAFGVNIPLRWSVAHVLQAIRDGEPHVRHIAHLTTLAGYVHWQLTGERVLGIGDASGMFPVDGAARAFDAGLLERFDALVADADLGWRLADVLPAIRTAGDPAGTLTPAGALLLDASGGVAPGAVLCPPEGDAGTGMVATNAIAPRTGNVSTGTSIFAMIVLERPLSELHREIGIVATPAGDPAAIVHANNGASELGEWAALFVRFAHAAGFEIDHDRAFATLLAEAKAAPPDAGGVLAYNLLAGEAILALPEGRPLVTRSTAAELSLGSLMRAQVYAAFATLALGMRVLASEGVRLDLMQAHGGMFRTEGVAQRLLAAALDTTVAVSATASEGGAWGMALLAAYVERADEESLAEYLERRVFRDALETRVAPDPADVAGFGAYLDRYVAGLPIQVAAAAI